MLLVAGFAAQAQAPAAPMASSNAQAKELATRLGREQSLEGLETIVAARNVDLFAAYERGWREATAVRPPQPLPAAIEAVIVKHYTDPVMGPALRTLCSANWTPYRTRALFDLMFAEWRSGKVRPSTYPLRDAVLRTELAGIEPPLVEWLRARDPPGTEDMKAIVGFLGRRGNEPAIPVLAALQAQGDRGVEQMASMALLEIRTPEAIEAVLARLASLRGPAASGAQREDREFIAARVAELPTSVPLPYARLRAALPDGVRTHSLAWLGARKDPDAVPDALAVLGETSHYPRSLEVLVASDSPQVWKQARAEVERLKQQGRLDDGQYRYASTLLDGKIADPEKHLAETRQQRLAQELHDRRGTLSRGRTEAQKLRASDPEKYVVAMREYLAALVRLVDEYRQLPAATGARNDIAWDYLDLGHFVRFRLKRPRESLDLYAGSQRAGGKLGGYGLADTLQFDLRDPQRALAEYRKLLEEASPAAVQAGLMDPAVAAWARRWLDAQIRHLSSGKKFTGTIGPEDLSGAAMWLYLGAAAGGREDVFGLAPLLERAPSDRREVARVLDALPVSGFVLMRTASLVGLMPDARSILAFLDRQDPAGYASATLFGVVEMAERGAEGGQYARLLPGVPGLGAQPSPMSEAKKRFLRERRIEVRR